MKKLLIAFLIVGALLSATGCTAQSRAKNYGGSYTMNLEPGQKLVEMTWKDDDLWILTRPMKAGEEPETYTFQEDSTYGIFEGVVTVVESKK